MRWMDVAIAQQCVANRRLEGEANQDRNCRGYIPDTKLRVTQLARNSNWGKGPESTLSGTLVWIIGHSRIK